MQGYFTQRLLLVIPTFIGITLLVFTLTRLVPGGPIERMLVEAQLSSGDASSSAEGFGAQSLSEDQLDQLKAYYGFDDPILVSYGKWLWKILQLDLGESTRYGEPVWESIKERLPISTFYGVTTLILTYLICIPLGISKALRHGTKFDHATSAFIFVSYAIPGYVIGIACIAYFAANLEWFPLGGFVSDEFEDLTTWQQFKDVLHHSALPLLAYMAGSLAVMTFMMKNALMENLAADYVRTATAKGLNFKQAIQKHALRNSLIPLATHFGQNISVILGGSFLIEKIFNIDGIGLLGYEALVERDYPVVMGILVISAVLYLIGNILSDICVALADPRIRFGEKTLMLSPQAKQRWLRFKSQKRGYYSLVLIAALIVLSLFAELWVNNRPIVVSYNDTLYFPTYGDIIPGSTFGLNYEWETNYKELKEQFKQDKNNWLIMPPVPFNPFENDFIEGEYPPYAPSIQTGHYLGTDMAGRDVLSRLVYGFRIAIFFSLFLLAVSYIIGIILGALMGYLGGTFDLVFQRIIEILSNVPILYIIMIVASIITPNFWTLALLLAAFSWMGLTWYMRTETYRESTREYVLAAKSIGASNWRIMFKHILPNSVSILITFFPFSVVSGITALTSLDYLGFGLPVPTPSWGELLQQGTSNLEYQWIAGSAVAALSLILTLVTFIGEAIREAFDPKKYSYYE